MYIKIVFNDDEDDVFEEMANFSKWFTENNIIPNKGEGFFVSEEEIKGFEIETKYAYSTEWIVTHKFHEPHLDRISIWCKCVNRID